MAPSARDMAQAFYREVWEKEVFTSALKEYLTAWREVAAFLEGPTDKVHEEYVKYPWIWEFVPPAKSPSGLQATRREFDINPTLTLDILKAFAKSFTIQEIEIQMCKQCARPTCFLHICNGLRKGIPRLDSSLHTTAPDEKVGTYDFSDISGVINENIVAEHTKVSDDIIARLKEYDKTYWTPSTSPGKNMLQSFRNGICR